MVLRELEPYGEQCSVVFENFARREHKRLILVQNLFEIAHPLGFLGRPLGFRSSLRQGPVASNPN